MVLGMAKTDDKPKGAGAGAGSGSGVDGERAKAIELTVASIEKQFGKGAIMRMGEDQSLLPQVETISSGSISLDVAIGIGGFPRGRVVEIFGPESSGKTTLTLHVVAEAQRQGGV